MDKRHAIQLLPEPYAKALQLKHEGLNDVEIADELGIDTESVEPCLKLAEAKLANLLDGQTIDLTDGDQASDVELRLDFDPTRAGSDE